MAEPKDTGTTPKTTPAKKPRASKKKPVTKVTIQYGWESYDIDLQKQLPDELFKDNYKKQKYIAADLVRAIMRETGDITVNTDISDVVFGSKSWTLKGKATIKFASDGELVTATAMDILTKSSIVKACNGQSARVVALAIKAALKTRYRCFEWDYSEGAGYNAEEEAEQNAIPPEADQSKDTTVESVEKGKKKEADKKKKKTEDEPKEEVVNPATGEVVEEKEEEEEAEITLQVISDQFVSQVTVINEENGEVTKGDLMKFCGELADKYGVPKDQAERRENAIYKLIKEALAMTKETLGMK